MTKAAATGFYPSRRSVIRSAALLGAGAAFAPLARLLADEKAESYVVLIVCDALRADHVGCYGHERVIGGEKRSTTPNIDALAAGGVLYENCIAQSSWTQTSVASLLYSAWPVLKGDAHNFFYVRTDIDALKSAVPGKYRLAVHSNPYLADAVFSRQFDLFEDATPPGDATAPKGYAPAKVANASFDWVAAPVLRKGTPLFAYVHYMDPHEPYDYKHEFRGTLAAKDWSYSPPYWLNDQLVPYRDDTGMITGEAPKDIVYKMTGMADAYDEDIMYLDKYLQGFLNYLKSYRILDRTTVILAGDHGQAFGEHGWSGHKMSLYQEETHVPLIITGPDVPRGVRVRSQVRNVDILPTIAAVMGASPAGYVGTPLLPADRAEGQGNRFAYLCCDYAQYGKERRLLTSLITRERQKYIRIMTKDHKLLREELYDLSADPAEKTNLIATRADLAKDIAGKMAAFEASAYWQAGSGLTPTMDKDRLEQLRALGYIGN